MVEFTRDPIWALREIFKLSFKEKTLDHFYDDNYPREREKIMVQESQGSVVVPSNYGNEKT